MLQLLKYNNKQTDDVSFKIISGIESLKFFAKRAGYMILCLYSTIFVASIDPFARSKFEPLVFYIGGILTAFIFIRFCNHLIKYFKYNKGSITLKSNKIICTGVNGNLEISADTIKKTEVNLLGNIVFNGDKSVTFPIMLISEKDRKEFISYFEDLSQNRTVFFKKIYDFIDALFVAFILAMHIREYIIQAYFIPSGSMEDTLLIGDHLLVEKITYGPVIPKMIGMEKEIHLNFLGLRDIKRNDILIFKPPNETERDFIKRCIALPGDELHIKDNAVYVNGKRLDEPFTKGITDYTYFSEKKIEGIVPDGNIVVLGDNRENSSDARAFGYLPVERIKGKAFILYWNTKQLKNFDFSRFGLIR
jgi:signal peptidase I